MATYSTTIIIQGNLGISDAEFIKLLELGKQETSRDNHKIGKENATYDYALSGGSRDEVYVSTFDNFTVIVSHALISDFSITRGLLRARVANIFPTSEYFLFFTETVSMLNGFVHGKGFDTYRKKYVQNGKYVDIFDHEADWGALLQEEIKYYAINLDFENSYPIKNKDYMFGSGDFDIALAFIERHFNVTSLSKKLETLLFNRDICAELTPEYIEQTSKKIYEPEFKKRCVDSVAPLMKKLKLKKIDFKETNQSQKSRGYYKILNSKSRIALQIYIDAAWGRYYCSMLLVVQPNDENLSNIFASNCVYRNPLGIAIFKLESRELMAEHYNGKVSPIRCWSDFDLFLSFLQEYQSTFENLINFFNQCDDNWELFFQNEDYFEFCLKAIKKSYLTKKYIDSAEFINYCLNYYYYNQSEQIANKILDVIDVEYQSPSDTLIHDHNKLLKLAKEIIKKHQIPNN